MAAGFAAFVARPADASYPRSAFPDPPSARKMGTARTWGLRFARLVAVVGHLVLGPVIFLSGLVVHPAIYGAGLVAWLAGFVVMSRWWRAHPGRVIAIPLTLLAAYVLAVLVANEFGLVGA